MDIRNLINLLPGYFRESDTYKNGQGEGILERFLKVIGDYFKDDIKTNIDNLLVKVLEVDTMDLKLLNLIWEYLGSVPYSHAILVDNSLSLYGSRIITTFEDNEKPRARYIDLIKHIVSLYKIRGTLDFYPALLRFYNLEAIVRDPTGDYINPDSQIASGIYIPLYDTNLIYDSQVTYDESSVGSVCINVVIIVAITEDLRDNLIFRERLYNLLNKYRPVYIRKFDSANVVLTIDGEAINTGFPYTFPFILS